MAENWAVAVIYHGPAHTLDQDQQSWPVASTIQTSHIIPEELLEIG